MMAVGRRTFPAPAGIVPVRWSPQGFLHWIPRQRGVEAPPTGGVSLSGFRHQFGQRLAPGGAFRRGGCGALVAGVVRPMAAPAQRL